MCTVSFLPTADWFSSRDESRRKTDTRLPRFRRTFLRTVVVAPSTRASLTDGPWLAVNDAGLCLALINWHRIKRESEGKIESRGFIIPQLIGASNGGAVGRVLRKLELDRVRPFRLIAIDSSRKEVTEWQWNLRTLKARRHSWRTQHWFSSGYDEPEAEKQREKVCFGSSLGKSSSLKKLHSSHLPKRGPFSICMHRPDAATVSYSEVVVGAKRITFRYQPGPPCRDRGRVARSLSL